MRGTVYALVTLLVVSSLVASAAAQETAVNVILGIAQNALPIGQTGLVDVTVRNIVNSSVQLFFVGLRFDWNKPKFLLFGTLSLGLPTSLSLDYRAAPILARIA